MEKIGIGIIGLGYVGSTHLKHAVRMPSINYVSVSDISKKALVKAENYRVNKTFTDYEELLRDPNIDAVVIALPTHLHLQCAIQAAEAGKHVLLEKPIARNLDEAKKIVTAAEKNSVKLMMGYHFRFQQSFRELKTRIDQGGLGAVEIAYGTFIGPGPFFHRGGHTPVRVPEWWFQKELTGGGALIDVGSHIIDLFRWYFGEIKEIKATFGYRFNLDFEDSAICLCKFQSGASAVITAGYFSQRDKVEVELFGTVDHALVGREYSRNRLLALTKMLITGLSDFHRAHFSELEYFANCILSGTLPSPSGRDGLKDLEAICSAYRNKMETFPAGNC